MIMTSNNQMEILAAIRGLEYVQERNYQNSVDIYTDSYFCSY